MFDFSFLHGQDVIAINNRSELQDILCCFEEAGICWMTGNRATKIRPDPIRYIRFNRPENNSPFLTYGENRTQRKL